MDYLVRCSHLWLVLKPCVSESNAVKIVDFITKFYRFFSHQCCKHRWAFLIACCLPFVEPFSHFQPNWPAWAQNILERRVCLNEGQSSFPKESEIVKIHWRHLEFSSRTTQQISTKLYVLDKGNSNLSKNKGHALFLWETIMKKLKIQTFFPTEPLWQFQSNKTKTSFG